MERDKLKAVDHTGFQNQCSGPCSASPPSASTLVPAHSVRMLHCVTLVVMFSFLVVVIMKTIVVFCPHVPPSPAFCSLLLPSAPCKGVGDKRRYGSPSANPQRYSYVAVVGVVSTVLTSQLTTQQAHTQRYIKI